jgi:membrane protease YdiL (CAAX protease family)
VGTLLIALISNAGGPVVALAVGGPILVVVAWTIVRMGRASVWVTMATCMGSLGILSLLTGEVRTGERPSLPAMVILGLGAGVALYLATAVFLSVVRRWRMLARHAAALYAQRGGLSLGTVIVLAAVISAGGEELLWRGVVQGVSVGAFGKVAGALLAWGAYVAANFFSGSLPIILGGIVGGAAWTALALWTGGIVAGLACHAAWTALMVALPPIPTEDRP